MARYNLEISERIVEPPFIILKPEVSEKEFFEFATEDIACELIEEVLVIHSPASLEHENTFKFILVLLDLFLKNTNQGKVIGSQFAMRLSAKIIFEPDLIVVLPPSLSKLKPTYLDGPSEFVIETLSPATKETDLTKKISHYLEEGVREIWAIDPSKRELTAFSPKIVPKIYSREETVKSTVITNFWIKLNWLWNSEKQDPLSCLYEIVK